MYDAVLEKPHDLVAFREVARGLAASGIPPEKIVWHEGAEGGLFARPDLPGAEGAPLNVPSGFVRLAEDVICHRDPERLALLYALLWRLTHGERGLLAVAADPLVHRLERMQKAIRRDIHKMHAFVRFRRVEVREWRAFHRLVRTAALYFAARRALLRRPLRRHAMVDPDALWAPRIGTARSLASGKR